jgi:hypothetical protein
MEAEYIALSDASCELLAQLTFFTSISMEITHPTLYRDNEAAKSIVKREPDYRRSKHIDIRYHFVGDHYEQGTFNVEHIPTNQQLADIVMKPLTRIKHETIVHALRLS